MGAVHRALLTASGGRVGWSISGMPVIELTTTGRKSGEPRTTMLTAAWQSGDTLAIVASAGGNDRHPSWFLNLSDDPEVKVRTENGISPMRARVLEGAERTERWDEIASKHKNYAGYQTKTDREIPIVLLEPAD